MARPRTKKFDRHALEAGYRAGTMTIRDLAREHGLSEGMVRHLAKTEGWERDLTVKIKRRVTTLVRREVVAERRGQQKSTREIAKRLPEETERETIEAVAEAMIRVRREHSKLITRSRALCFKLFDELEEQCMPTVIDGDANGVKFVPEERLPVRADVFKKLNDALKTVVSLERESLGMDAAPLEEADLTRISDSDVQHRLNTLLSRAKSA